MISILPQGATPAEEEAVQPSRTYRIDFERGRVIGMVDGLEAVRQAVYKIIQTDRFAHVIYGGQYGRQRSSPEEIQFYIEEALLADDRITAVSDFRVNTDGDEMTVSFVVTTIFGTTRFEGSVGPLV
mgnify:CR=1 FL=1